MAVIKIQKIQLSKSKLFFYIKNIPEQTLTENSFNKGILW